MNCQHAAKNYFIELHTQHQLGQHYNTFAKACMVVLPNLFVQAERYPGISPQACIIIKFNCLMHSHDLKIAEIRDPEE